MRIIQTKGSIQNGQLIIDESQSLSSIKDQDVQVVIVVKNDQIEDDFAQARSEMQAAFKQAGIESNDDILSLIKEVKLELLAERQLL